MVTQTMKLPTAVERVKTERGIYLRRGKFDVRIRHNSKERYLGRYNSLLEAVIARDKFLSEVQVNKVGRPARRPPIHQMEETCVRCIRPRANGSNLCKHHIEIQKRIEKKLESLDRKGAEE